MGATPAGDAPSLASGTPFSVRIDPALGLPVALWSVTSAGGVLLFALAYRQFARRDAELAAVPFPRMDPDTRHALPAARPTAAAVHDRPVTGGPSRLGDEGIAVQPHPHEANQARWLRPSLRAERQAGGRDSLPASHDPVRFDAPARPGVERRRISYRLVRLSEGPDDIRSAEIGRLDRGDEVEILGEAPGFLQVRTPAGLVGWVPSVVTVG